MWKYISINYPNNTPKWLRWNWFFPRKQNFNKLMLTTSCCYLDWNCAILYHQIEHTMLYNEE
jgi:hypothetical protein